MAFYLWWNVWPSIQLILLWISSAFQVYNAIVYHKHPNLIEINFLKFIQMIAVHVNSYFMNKDCSWEMACINILKQSNLIIITMW